MNGDARLRAAYGAVPVPTFENTARAQPPLLGDATVALVTTAGLHLPGTQDAWGVEDASYRRLPSDRRDLQLAHHSANWDRASLAADLNVVYPVDRLDEFATEGLIGAVSPFHISFMGGLHEALTTIRLDTGIAAAHELLDAEVDIVLLTPV